MCKLYFESLTIKIYFIKYYLRVRLLNNNLNVYDAMKGELK